MPGPLFVRKATDQDYERIMEIYRYAQDFMIRSGNPNQWAHSYPEPELIREDIQNGISMVICDDSDIHGVFALFKGEDPTYGYIENGKWLENRIMQKAITKCGFRKCGIIYLENGSPRIAYHWSRD